MFNNERAKKLVKSSQLKRSAIAKDCRVNVETLTKYLNGAINPSKAVIALLAQALKVPESTLTVIEEETPKAS